MPYKIVKVRGGYKVQNIKTKQMFSSYALTRETAQRQKLALEISESK
jgi:hypothetical protein